MNRREKLPSPVGVGAMTVLTVLLVLVLTVFAALTLSTARADLALSQANAEAVRAYYAADSEAVRLAEEFSQGLEPELEATLPLSDSLSLYIHLVREGDGSVAVLAWQTVPAGAEPEADDTLPIWDGTLPV